MQKTNLHDMTLAIHLALVMKEADSSKIFK